MASSKAKMHQIRFSLGEPQTPLERSPGPVAGFKESISAPPVPAPVANFTF